MTTTIGEKLRAEAAELRRKAEALEIAAGVMDGQQLGVKQKGAAQAFAQAATLRAKQKAGTNGAGSAYGLGLGQPSIHRALVGPPPRGGLSRQEREAFLRQALATGPQTTRDLQQLFEAHGVSVTPSRVGQILKAMSDLTSIGQGNKSRWTLASQAPLPPPTRRTKPAPPHYWEAEQKRARRQRTAEYLATFDRETPRTAKGSKGLKGIGPLILYGYLKPKGDGYVRTAKEYRP